MRFVKHIEYSSLANNKSISIFNLTLRSLPARRFCALLLHQEDYAPHGQHCFGMRLPDSKSSAMKSKKNKASIFCILPSAVLLIPDN